MSTISAKVNWIKMYNEEDCYAILECSDEEEKFSVLGTVTDPIRGQKYSFDGEWSVHPKYGRQFKAISGEMILPTSKMGILELLSAGAIPGLGKVNAKRIVSHFGEQSLDIIENSPERLTEVKGIGKKMMDKIAFGWKERQGVIELQRFLQDCGVSMLLGPKIYKKYGQDSIQTIKENPYILTQDLWGVNFRTADIIAKELGLSATDANRLRAYVIYYLKRNANSGHCFERASVLVYKCAQSLHVDQRAVADRIRKMLDERDSIKDDDDVVYLKTYYYAEDNIARKLYEISQFEGYTVKADIEHLEDIFGIEYDEIQAQAIRRAVQSKIAVITGGPGTGKTTIIRAIVKAFTENHKSVILASPTGRAANRMAEVVGMGAKTVHRLLEYRPDVGFVRDKDNPIEGDVLIVDECSMMDVVLMSNLLDAVPAHMNVILVGDVDQLPSVGPGNVLSDIIRSDCYYTVKLERVFRQARESDIVMNAHRINRGEHIVLRNRDVRFIQTNDIKGEILKIATKLEKASDVQVLAPMKKTDVGTNELNNALQDAINKKPVVIERKYMKYRIGDRVMQIRNNYEKDVFNGTLGTVHSYDEDSKILTVDFDGTYVQYDNTDLEELMLAYAITVHKSQGSEFPVVVIPLSMQHRSMLQRNLIYTAFTRPSKKLYLVGDMRALNYAIDNYRAMERKTRLIERLRQWQ